MPTALQPTAEQVSELIRLHRATRYLDAFRFAQHLSPAETWADPTAVIWAGRLYSCWGDAGRSNRLHTRAWRMAPDAPAAVYFYALTLEHKHGPFFALSFVRGQPRRNEPAGGERHGDWLRLLEARWTASFRDFDAANAVLDETAANGANDPWWWVEQARIREQEDRYDEALASAQHALTIRPDYRPALETVAHVMMLLNRDPDAAALLQDAVGRLQSSSLAQMLAILWSEMGRHEDTLRALALVEEWAPCATDAYRSWLAARHSDAFRALGRHAESADHALRAKNGFHGHIAASAASAAAGKCVVLPVPFVRQHHLTCAPATLAALGRFWNQPVDHLELARVICYDGTPDHEERFWAETNGWCVREFRVTWEVAVALIDRGCPFTLTTVATRSAHLQAVVGYDSGYGLLMIRDPYQRTHGEFVAKPYLEQAASHGPRGMIVVPAGQAALLEGIELPDAALYDRWYALRRALVAHDRARAQQEADALRAADPQHLCTFKAERELALYDGHMPQQLEATRRLRALFPDDANYHLDELQMLRALGRADELNAALRTCKRYGEVAFLRERAEVLMNDAQTQRRAMKDMWRVLRRAPVDAGNLYTVAQLLWLQQNFAPSAEVYRLAACTGDKTEYLWDALFSASRHTQQTDSVIALLHRRNERLGGQSGHPAQTLFRALDALDRTTEGFAMLEQAAVRRPGDGNLSLFLADNRGRYGDRERSNAALAAAEGRTSRSDWLRTAARLATYRSEHAVALGYWREFATLKPLDYNAHAAIASLLEILEGREVALRFLETACAQHPNYLPLHKLLLEWLRQEPPARALAVLDHLLRIDPAHAWALRERALTYRRDRRLDEALADAEAANRIEPSSAYSPGVMGMILLELNRMDDGRAALERALRLDVGSGYIFTFVDAASDFAGRRAALAFVQSEITRQAAADGDAVLRFREVARRMLSPAELRAALESLLAAHPDRWAMWSALGSHLLDVGEIEAALQRATDASGRFPLVPRLWVDLAAAQSRARQPDAEVESLQRALALSPGWGFAARELAAAYERALRLDDAEHVLRRALAADPVDGITYGHLADLLRRRGRLAEAMTLIERAVMLNPSYDWAWHRFDEWAEADGDKDRVRRLLETITQARPGEASAWIRLARFQCDVLDAALASLDRAAEREPRNPDIYDLRAELLAGAGRYDEAEAVCRPAIFGLRVPYILEGRAAWIDHARGRIQAARDRMRAVVAAHPDYAWGWSCVTEWSWELDDLAAVVEGAEKWAWLSPAAAVPLGYWAAARLREGKRREAKDLFWRTLYADPTYAYGAQRLLDMLTEDRELDEATRLLRHIETHFAPADAQRAAVSYHIMRRDKEAAANELAKLSLAPAESTHRLEQAIEALNGAGWRDVVERTLAARLNDPKANAEIGRYWVRARAPKSPWRTIRRLDRASAPEAIRIGAWSAALQELGRKKAHLRLRWVVRWHRAWLRQHVDLWSSTGYAFATLGGWRAATKWLADWRERPDARPWALHNLALAWYSRKRGPEAAEVVRHALTLRADHTEPSFLVWSGLEAALRDDLDVAQDALARTRGASLSAYMNATRQLLEIVAAFQHNGATQVPLKEAQRRLREWQVQSAAHADAGLVYHRDRVMRYIGKRGKSLRLRLSSWLPMTGRSYQAGAWKHSAWIAWLLIVLAAQVSRCAGG